MTDNVNTVYCELKYTRKPDDYTGPRWQPWWILVVSGDNGQPMFKTTENYTNRQDAIHAADKCFGPNADVYLRVDGAEDVAFRLASEFNNGEPPPAPGPQRDDDAPAQGADDVG